MDNQTVVTAAALQLANYLAINTLLTGTQPPREFSKALTGTMVAQRPHSLLYLAGLPAAAAAPAPGIGGAVLTSYAGQIPFLPTGKARLVRFQGMATIAGLLMLCDRLWHNSGITITSTSEQVFTSSAQIPPRDVNGLNSGVGVLAAVEVSSLVGAGTPTLTLKYTNQDGVADKTATNINATIAAPIAGTFHQIGLANGDTGIRKAQSLTLSATWTSGTIHVVLYRVLAVLGLAALLPNTIDAIQSGLPILWESTVPFLVFIPSTTTTSLIQGHVLFTKV